MRSELDVRRAQLLVERRDVHLQPKTPLIGEIQPQSGVHPLANPPATRICHAEAGPLTGAPPRPAATRALQRPE